MGSLTSQTGGLKSNLEILQQKAKERTVKTQNIEYDLDTLVKRIAKKSIKLDPEYQRRHRWTKEASSRLIESLILNIPIPVIFISQDVDVDDEVGDSTSRYTVIDGQQRLTAVYEFMTGELQLSGLETLSELNGCFLKDLPSFLTRRLEERTIKCLRIDSTVDPQVKYDIFERLNTGSVKLESQELRNATARGPFNDALKKMAESRPFRILIQVDPENPGTSPKVQKMEDVELVLRFFALGDGGYLNLRKGFREFLTTSLVSLNELGEVEVEKKAKKFKSYMSVIRKYAGDMAFAKYRYEGGEYKRMSTFNAAVYDAVAVGISEAFSIEELRSKEEEISKKLSSYKILFRDHGFFGAVSGSVNDAAKVNERIEAFIYFLKK